MLEAAQPAQPRADLKPDDTAAPTTGAAAVYRRYPSLLACEHAYTHDAWARDRDGQALHNVSDIRQRAASRCLLGAVESVTHDPGIQQQLIAAVRDAIELRCGRPMTIVAYTAAATHREVLAVIATAIDLTATRTWGTHARLQLPAGATQRPGRRAARLRAPVPV